MVHIINIQWNMYFILCSNQVKLLYSSKSSYSPKWEQRKCQLSSVHQSQSCWLMSRHWLSGPGSLSVTLLLTRNKTDTSNMNKYHLTETFLSVLFKSLGILEKFLWLFLLDLGWVCVDVTASVCVWWLELYSASVQICWHIRWLQAVRQKKFLMAF